MDKDEDKKSSKWIKSKDHNFESFIVLNLEDDCTSHLTYSPYMHNVYTDHPWDI